MPINNDDIVISQVAGFLTPGGLRWMMTFHHQVDGSPAIGTTYGDLLTISAKVHSIIKDDLLPLLSNGLTLLNTKSFRVAPTPSVQAMTSDTDIGGVSGGNLEPNTALCASFRSDFAGRSGMGRVFVPGVPTGVNTNGQVDETFAADVEAVLLDLMTTTHTVGAGSIQGVVWSPTIWASTGLIADAAHSIIACRTDLILRRQTRRDWKGQNYI